MDARLSELREFVATVDRDLQRSFPFVVEEVRDSGAGSGIYTVKGHAAVFDKWSLDLGGFRERVAREAFDDVLSKNPHVLHLWDHDTSKALSSTRSKEYPLELRVDPAGLRFYSKVAPTSYASDLRILLESGVVDQASFAFTVAKDEWRITEDEAGERVERTILEVAELFDVTTCAMGAYPTTDSVLATRSLLNKVSGRLHEEALEQLGVVAPSTGDSGDAVAPDAGGTQAPQESLDAAETRDDKPRAQELADLKAYVKDATRRARERVHNVESKESQR